MLRLTRTTWILLASLLFFVCFSHTALAIPIVSPDNFAWGENIGWLNWGTSEGDVFFPRGSGELSGYVWGENVGWLSLNCSNTASCGTVDYAVSYTGDELVGYAWGENIGWVSFSCVNTGSCGVVDYRVLVENETGIFTGFAWGENIGWISTNCANTGSCATVNYRVMTQSPPRTSPSQFIPTPPSSAGPNIIVRKIPSASSVRAGDPLTYSVSIENIGNGAATSVVVVDTIDSDTTLVSVVPTPASSTGSTFTFSPGTLAPGQSLNYTTQVRVRPGTPNGSSIVNTVTVTGANVSQVTATAATIVATAGVITPIPVGTPGPLPTTTPVGTPPPATPPSGPPTSTPPTPVVSAIDSFGRWLDELLARLFALFGPTLAGLCGTNAVQTVACGTTAIGILAVLAAIVAAMVQGEIFAALFLLLQMFGLRRKAAVWGVVYDTVTKRPVPMAKVSLISGAGRRLETRYADYDGRYGFLTTAAPDGQPLSVSLRASKPGYAFPSTRMNGDVDYVVYDQLYRGGVITLRQGEQAHHNIPMDPVSSNRVSLSGFGRSLFGTMGDRLLAFAFTIGLVILPLNYFLLPTTASMVMAVVFLLVNLFYLYVVYRPYGMTFDGATQKPLANTLVTLNDANGTRISFAVSDAYGRYVLKGTAGQSYELIVYTPAIVQPQRTARIRTEVLRGRGWVTQRLTI